MCSILIKFVNRILYMSGYPFFIIMFLLIGCTKQEKQTTITTPVEKVYSLDKLIVGADLSYANILQNKGAKYKEQGQIKDVYSIFKNRGCNMIRLRLWNEPSWQNNLFGSERTSDIVDVEKSMQKAKSLDIAVLLDFHYSDNWADPSKQVVPAKWKNLSLNDLKDSIYQYTFVTLDRLVKKNLMPEYVQLGNEVNNGMCHPIGKIINNNFASFHVLLTAAISAVEDVNKKHNVEIKKILHVAQLHEADYALNGLFSIKTLDVDFIGVSHYYLWAKINDLIKITEKIAEIRKKFGKEIFVMEAAFPWTTQSFDQYNNIFSGEKTVVGYPFNKEGQKKYMIDLVQAIIDGGGKGIVYWGGEWISTPAFKDQWGTGSSWENAALFDFNGEVLPSFDYMSHKYKF